MKVDARRRHLWVTTTEFPQMVNFKKEEDGSSAVLKFDLRTRKLIKRYLPANKSGPHALGDLTINSGGDVFATDSLSAAVYVIRPRTDEIELFLDHEAFVSPQGLAFSDDERHLFMADYFIANSQWGLVDDKGQLAAEDKLRDPVILKMRL